MPPLRITAHLGSVIAASDDYSPSLDALLEWLWLDERGLATPNPSPDNLIQADLPIEKGEIGGEWYWKVSSPCYTIHSEEISRYRKRWDSHDRQLSWGKRKAKFNTSEGAEKAYDLPLYLRLTPAITWYAVGDKTGVEDLLSGCTGIGKKRAHGWGQISKWEVEETGDDWHLQRESQLMRPIPVSQMLPLLPCDFAILSWGWRPPAWLASNKVLCAMPMHTVKRTALVG
jgi:CRISPR type IV-associated protein Csf3